MSEDKNIDREYIDLFQNNRAAIDAPCCEDVNAQRDAAFEKFSKKGFPTTKEENFHHTDIMSFFVQDYGVDIAGKTANTNAIKDFVCSVPGIQTYVIYIINGWFYAGNIVNDLPEGVVLCSFSEAGQKHPELIKKYYNQQAKDSEDTTVQFNTMLAQDGIFLYVPKGLKLDKPIQIINVLSAGVDLLSTQRGLFIIEDMAEAKVLICDHALTYQNYAANHVREIFVGDNASFEYYLIENQHYKVNQIISSFISQEANSNVQSGVITLHNGHTRNNTMVALKGENANTELYGMALTDKAQHVDNYTYIDHAVPNCTSNELFKYVLNDKSTAAFKGHVLVRPDAQKTSAYQTNKNICLTPDAYVNTRPQLEIYADDVKCSHGATIGQLDEEALFYMKTRGISAKEARMLLMFAFTHEVVEKISLEPLKEHLKPLIEQRLRGDEIIRCKGCSLCGKGL